MSGVTKALAQGLGKQTWREAVSNGGWKVLIDGNLGSTLVEHQPGATLVGTDKHGNRYFEKMDTQVGRNRWVVYAKASDYRGQDPANVPAEWHGWLHASVDVNPANHDFTAPIYASNIVGNSTTTVSRYQPKGSWFKEHKRNWLKYQTWTPPKA
ncbi:NUO13 [Auxenochlorella protothecoides x Auxenochlorella symbiontica]|uniref:NADH dehydrogenase [ubiquinone] 1 alpha subcomplex subunit 12 n=1 Tax=Auxenochlorella protothecoides TaxID=3075 RepID=A0A087SNB3_AUXPR|nr:putative NADH dehydrogenase [ubiquinone] 1 alpha subcomplex subunit 12 [Auxenochlorella protothecoides]KFM27217.1 putative NADH dehydrogenase [ubiquinone] 1 alpha subcomplex subunit 12 [Auxenochlorella protothecoides]